MSPNPVGEVSLQEESINSKGSLLIDPDNVFWALIADKASGGEAREKIYSLYTRLKQGLDASMREFRFRNAFNSVYINPTDRCNADCPYCYIPASRRKYGNQMDPQQLLQVMRKIDKYFTGYRNKSSAKPVVIYHGSEPLMVKEMLFASIKKFHKKFHFGIQTNAFFMTKEDVEFLKSHKVSVGISLDSSDAVINNYTRRVGGDGSFDKTLQAINYFKGYEGLSVITTITKYNVKHLPALVRFLHAQGVTCLLLNPVRATRDSVVKLRPDQEELTHYFLKAVKEALRLSQESKHRIIIGNFSNIVLGIVAPQARRLMCDISPCGGGRCFLAVTASGDMIPCGEFIGLKEFSGGNIFSSSIKKAIFSEPFKKVRGRIVEKIAECDICLYRNICGAPCPAEVYSLSKKLNAKSPYCEFYKQIINYAFKLIADDQTKYLFHQEAVENIKYEYKLDQWNG